MIEPLVPVDLVVDHSVQVDFAGSAIALQRNLAMEFVHGVREQDLAARGMTGQSRVISSGRGRATPEAGVALGLGPNAPVTRITRLRSADGQPLAVEATTVLSEALANPRLISDSLHETMETCGKRPVRAVQRLTAVAIALAATAGLIGALLIWRSRFALGPFEWVLRRITYARFKA